MSTCNGVNVHFSSESCAPPSTLAPRSSRIRAHLQCPLAAAWVSAVQCCVSPFTAGWAALLGGVSISTPAPASNNAFATQALNYNRLFLALN